MAQPKQETDIVLRHPATRRAVRGAMPKGLRPRYGLYQFSFQMKQTISLIC